jgi:hypothetical protein
MGWHYILHVSCKLLPEYRDFIEQEYLQTFREREDYDAPYYNSDSDSGSSETSDSQYSSEKAFETRRTLYTNASKFYRDLIDIWKTLDIASRFQEYSLQGYEFKCEISKLLRDHNGDLREDYVKFVKDILVPITSEITYCEIESDDCGDYRYYYTDTELRNISFNLRDKIKSVHHIYNEGCTEILESRVIYKHSIQKRQFTDLDRAYKGY